MKETTNYKIRKPDPTEFFNIEEHFNYNSDIIDRAIKEAKDTADSKAPGKHTHDASDIKGISTDADGTSYDNTNSKLTSTNVQGAIDELNTKANDNETSILGHGESIKNLEIELNGQRARGIIIANNLLAKL